MSSNFLHPEGVYITVGEYIITFFTQSPKKNPIESNWTAVFAPLGYCANGYIVGLFRLSVLKMKKYYGSMVMNVFVAFFNAMAILGLHHISICIVFAIKNFYSS